MKVRFYVTVEVPAPNSPVGKQSKSEIKEWAQDYINERMSDSIPDLNPSNVVVRFPRTTK